jgi:hypothetical protein
LTINFSEYVIKSKCAYFSGPTGMAVGFFGVA